MRIIIDIDKNVYTRLFDNGTDFYDTDDILAMAKAIRKGTPLPKGHGRILDEKISLIPKIMMAVGMILLICLNILQELKQL